MEQTFSGAAAARRLGVTPSTLHRWASQGHIESVMVDGYKYPRFTLSAIEEAEKFNGDRRSATRSDGRCRDCERKVPIYRFGRCRACDREKQIKANSKRDDRAFLDWHYRTNFGITYETYLKMFKRQKGLCAICKKPERETVNGKIKRLAVDHDHKTGKVRGLLCGKCNRLLHAAEKKGWLKKSLRYLASY